MDLVNWFNLARKLIMNKLNHKLNSSIKIQQLVVLMVVINFQRLLRTLRYFNNNNLLTLKKPYNPKNPVKAKVILQKTKYFNKIQ